MSVERGCPAEAGAASCELASGGIGACPRCRERGKPVDSITVKSMLAVPLTQIRDVEYRFCKSPRCPVVYFPADGQDYFAQEHLRELVHQKHLTSDDVPVCYCFRHTPGSIRREFLETGTVTVIERITEGIQSGKCACDIRNPQGSCCLGNVRAVVKQARPGESQQSPGG